MGITEPGRWPDLRDRAGDLDVRIGETVEISSSYRYCWFPGVHEFPTGEILATIRMSPDEWNPEGAFSAYCVSRDGGLTWSHRYTMGPGANPDGAYTREPRPDGSILQLWHWLEPYPPGQARRFRTTLTRYTRGGMEVNQIRDAIIHFDEPLHMVPAKLHGFGILEDASRLKDVPDLWMFGSIIPALNGDLLATMNCHLAQDTRYSRSMLIRSADEGRTWREYATIAAVEPDEGPWPGMGRYGPTETGMVRLADDRLYAIFRTYSDDPPGQAYMAHTWSEDDGKTWTKPVSTPHQGVAPRVRLLSSGVLACTYGRPGPVTIMFSLDGTGERWSHLTELFAEMSTRYTDLIEVKPGRVLVVYDSVPYGWKPIPYAACFEGHESWDGKAKNTVYGTFVEVRRK